MTSDDSARAPDSPVVASVLPLIPAWRVDRVFDYSVPAELSDKVDVGSLVRVPFGNRRVRAIVIRIQGQSELGSIDGLEAVIAPVIDHPVIPESLIPLFFWIADRYASQASHVFGRAVPPRVRIQIEEPDPIVGGPEPQRTLSYRGGRQLIETLRSGRPGAWCVQYAPGEDRTRLIGELVAASRRPGAALVTVPEVRYGSQVLDGLGRLWPQMVRIDSAESDQDRARGWMSLAAGADFGVGGRGAVLAPSAQLSLIVVDEEHHASYKEDRSPRFDARRVALERARRQQAACVLMSSTPAVETAAARGMGTVGLVVPDRDALRAARPIVELVERPEGRALSHELHARVRDALRAGQRVALLAPRRGFARAMWCASCRRSVRCPRCEAGLVLHRSSSGGSERVRCGRCGFEGPSPRSCPSCGAEDFKLVGAGSERLAEQVKRAWPRASVTRADPDVIDEVVRDRKPSDIYVTTWIGTKPAIRPPVSLVGVLDADALLRRPDWRAAESGYQALAAMAEWAGPSRDGGRLVIQTAEPTHHAVQSVVRADYGFFLSRELPHREELGYPPFRELIKVSATGATAPNLIERAAAVGGSHGARVLGPIEVGTHRDDARLEVLMKCIDATPVGADLRGILATVPAGGRLRVDVDPR
ncbi:MAG: primosomal protein N' [Actinomycetota bacterium]|nr:primosomal protein N' [Actinomycetota bacterium]